MTEQTQAQLIAQQYYKEMDSFNVMRMRLDTQPLLDQIELFMRGARYTITQEEDGDFSTKKINVGVPKANDLGIQSVLNWLSSTINPHVVQGNFPMDKNKYSETYERYIKEFQINLGNYIVLNCYKWEVDDDEIEGIIDFIMNLVVPFMSRCIGDRERGSYAKTMESKEMYSTGGKGNIPMFKS